MHERTPKPVTVHLIRHAESEANRHGDIIGMVDARLTPAGVAQAEALARYLGASGLRPPLVYVSDMPRAAETAGLLATGLCLLPETVFPDPRLREIARGDWDGKRRSEIYTEALQAEMDLYDMDHRAPNGESMHDTAARMRAWLTEAVERALGRPSDLPVVAVTHGVAIKCLLQRVLGSDPKRTWRIQIDNTSITTLRCSPHGWDLVRVNATPHLATKF